MKKKPSTEERRDSKNTGHGSKFGRKKEDAIAALARNGTSKKLPARQVSVPGR
jgi:hypothetical protein